MAGMGWGGVIASALAGGAASAMSSIAGSLDDQMKAEIQRKREETIAALQRQNQAALARTNAELEIEMAPRKAQAAREAADADAEGAARRRGLVAAAEDAAKGHVLRPGEQLWKDGKLVAEGPEKKLTPEEIAYKEQLIAESKARERNYDSKSAATDKKTEGGGGAKEEKPRNEKNFDWKKVEGGERGTTRYLDSTTGYFREETAKVPGKKGDKGVLSGITGGYISRFEEPDTPEKPASVVYKDAEGNVVPFSVVEAKRKEVSGIKSDGSSAGASGSAASAAGMSVADIRAEATAALARPGANAAAIKARFKKLTGKDY